MNQEDTGFFEKHKEIVIVEPKWEKWNEYKINLDNRCFGLC
jgi:hypothetical protein